MSATAARSSPSSNSSGDWSSRQKSSGGGKGIGIGSLLWGPWKPPARRPGTAVRVRIPRPGDEGRLIITTRYEVSACVDALEYPLKR